VALCDQVTEPDGAPWWSGARPSGGDSRAYVPMIPPERGASPRSRPGGEGGIALALLAARGTGSLEAGTVSENEAASLLATFGPSGDLLPRGRKPERLPGRIRERSPEFLSAFWRGVTSTPPREKSASPPVSPWRVSPPTGCSTGDAAAGCARVALDYWRRPTSVPPGTCGASAPPTRDSFSIGRHHRAETLISWRGTRSPSSPF
jgi:hypothetical protein